MANSTNPIELVEDDVRRCLAFHVTSGQTLRVALSGGLDSVVLLDVLQRLGPERGIFLAALHVNHRLQAEADAWVAFCEGLCRDRGIPLSVAQVTVERLPGQSLEAEARRARYAVYESQTDDWLALAHQRDDQSETLLLQLLRGAGVRGLQAMPVVRALPTLGAPRLLRPLLTLDRALLARYAVARGLAWIEDPSNQDTRLARNFLRRRVAPLLDEGFPSWRSTLSRSAGHLASAQRLLDEMALQDFAFCRQDEGLEGRKLMTLPSDRGVNLLRWWVRRAGAPACSSARWEDWWGQCAARIDRHPRLHWQGWTVVRRRGVWQVFRDDDAAAESSAKPLRSC